MEREGSWGAGEGVRSARAAAKRSGESHEQTRARGGGEARLAQQCAARASDAPQPHAAVVRQPVPREHFTREPRLNALVREVKVDEHKAVARERREAPHVDADDVLSIGRPTHGDASSKVGQDLCHDPRSAEVLEHGNRGVREGLVNLPHSSKAGQFRIEDEHRNNGAGGRHGTAARCAAAATAARGEPRCRSKIC